MLAGSLDGDPIAHLNELQGPEEPFDRDEIEGSSFLLANWSRSDRLRKNMGGRIGNDRYVLFLMNRSVYVQAKDSRATRP